jgi:hypothetical protein
MFHHWHGRRSRHHFGRFDDVSGFGDVLGTKYWAGGWGHGWRNGWSSGYRRRRGSTAARILLAGLAVFAFVKLLSLLNRSNRSTAEKVGLGALLAMVAAVLLSLRGSGRRYR